MKMVVSVRAMAALDRYAINELQIPGIVLMENAGRGIAASARALLREKSGQYVQIYCGPGNNGGDGYVVARHLLNCGQNVDTFVLADRGKIRGDALTNLVILENMGAPVHFLERMPSAPVRKPDLLIDALLGTGVEGPLHGLFAECIHFLNHMQVPILAIDIPTGVHGDSGGVTGPAIAASRTCTMALLKSGLLFSPGREHAGEIEVIDISLPPAAQQKHTSQIWLTEEADIAALLPQRSPDTHKNRVGTVGLWCGSLGFCGAAALAAEASLRAGAGLSYLAIPLSLNPILAAKLTEVILWPFEDHGAGYLPRASKTKLLDRLDAQNALAVGPGLGQAEDTAELLSELLRSGRKPMVLDADGLNLAAHDLSLIRNYAAEMVLTPHPGELSRLIGCSSAEIARDRLNIAASTAGDLGKVLVLKGGPTLIATPAGDIYINPSGNPGMATAGTGDVLTGLVAGLLAQGLDAVSAARVGVYVHGLAGDLARQSGDEMSLLAGDILRSISAAFRQIRGTA